MLAKIATKVMQAFPGAFPKADVVGNPVRVDVLALPLPVLARLTGVKGRFVYWSSAALRGRAF